ncbi:SCAN domain-containing protein 3-like [Rhinichthys klamathensis goyatoka]|uniref:SCAN domain-containing protein 3-like n=1 Tax=Rhinichthys klamathensis goyatoka TaxID=3034132 RepID=UPI0024B4A95B|nr:SCAN domain-containing protein 3-like [Rhinichthys klamathensis goyatoka]
MASSKKRKVDGENRVFKDDWTERYAFILPQSSTKPFCLICNETVGVVKSGNVKRHYETKHRHFEQQYPQNTEVRTAKLRQLKSSYESTNKLLVRAVTQQERATEASFRVAWVLGKNKKPFSDAEIVKECLVEIADALFEGKERQEMSEKLKKIPLSNDTSTRRTEVLAHDLVKQLTDDIKDAPCVSLAVDESTDGTDQAQLCVFVRYFSKAKGTFCEDLLGLTPLCHTRGEDIYEAIMQMLNERGIDVKNIVSITTDGAPAMIGKEKGAVQRLKEEHSDLLTYHCNAAYDDLLLHNNVRWLSKGRVLERFWAIRKDLEMFLSQQKNVKARHYLDFLRDDDSMELVAFLVDITSHLNELNLKLQGQGNTVCDLMAAVRSFERRLEIFKSDITGPHIHFPTLLQQTNGNHHRHHLSFLEKLAENFRMRFEGFNIGRQVLLCIPSPFLVKNVEEFSKETKSIFPWASMASLQTELIDLQENVALQEVDCDTLTFWTKMVTAENFPNLQKVAICVLTMFGSTYRCESAFSAMNAVKNSYRSSLTNEHLGQCLRLATTPFVPRFRQLMGDRQCHFSH